MQLPALWSKSLDMMVHFKPLHCSSNFILAETFQEVSKNFSSKGERSSHSVLKAERNEQIGL